MKIINLLLAAFLVLAFNVSAFAQNEIREVYACDYNDGKDLEDLLSARDYHLAEGEKAGLEVINAVVWTPFKGDYSFDFLWINTHHDLATFAKNSDNFTASPVGAQILENYFNVASCSSTLTSRTVVFDGGKPPVSAPPAIISAYPCTFKPGASAASLGDLYRHIAEVLDGLGDHQEFIAFASQPITKGDDSADVYLYGVHDTVSAWAARQASARGTAEGQAMMRHIGAVLDCNSNLFYGQRMIPAN